MVKKLRSENLHSSYCPSDTVIVIVLVGVRWVGFGGETGRDRRSLEDVVNAKVVLKCGLKK
jgi:hypothetical protein